MNHTVTVEDVHRLFRENLTRELPGGGRKTAAEARQGARTEVHEELQAQLACPYVLAPPSRKFGAFEGAARNADIAERKKALRNSIPDALVLESERARGEVDGNHVDPVHYVQKKHQKALWVEADRLVTEALGGTP